MQHVEAGKFVCNEVVGYGQPFWVDLQLIVHQEKRENIANSFLWLSCCTCGLSRNVLCWYLPCLKEPYEGHQWHPLWSPLHMLQNNQWVRSGNLARFLIWDYCLYCPWGITKCIRQQHQGILTSTQNLNILHNPLLSASRHLHILLQNVFLKSSRQWGLPTPLLNQVQQIL